MPSASPTEPYKYGIILWIGEIPAIQGLVAGIELASALYYCNCYNFLYSVHTVLHTLIGHCPATILYRKIAGYNIPNLK